MVRREKYASKIAAAGSKFRRESNEHLFLFDAADNSDQVDCDCLEITRRLNELLARLVSIIYNCARTFYLVERISEKAALIVYCLRCFCVCFARAFIFSNFLSYTHTHTHLFLSGPCATCLLFCIFITVRLSLPLAHFQDSTSYRSAGPCPADYITIQYY